MSLKNLAVWNAKAVKLVIKMKCRIEKSCHALIVPWNAVTTRTKVKMLCHVKFMRVSRPILKEKKLCLKSCLIRNFAQQRFATHRIFLQSY